MTFGNSTFGRTKFLALVIWFVCLRIKEANFFWENVTGNDLLC